MSNKSNLGHNLSEERSGYRSWLIEQITSDRRKGLLTLGPVLALLTVFFVVPFLLLLAYSINQYQDVPIQQISLTMDHYARFFSPEALLSLEFGKLTYIQLLLKSLWVSLLVTFVSLVIAYPITYYIGQKAPQQYKTPLVMLVIIPFWTSYLIRTYAWMPILSQNGIINSALASVGLPKFQLLFTSFATNVGLVYVYLPFMILPLYASMSALDSSLIEAAQDLGATRRKVFREVIFPLTLPGAAAGSIFIFIKSAAAYITPTILGGSGGILYANVIVSQFREVFNWNFGAALSFILLTLVIIILGVGTRLGIDLQTNRVG